MPAAKTAPRKLPKTIGACADRLYEARAARLANNKISDALKAEETELKEHIINTLPKSDASGVAGKIARVAVTEKTVMQVDEWPAFYDWLIDEAIKHRRKKTGLEHSVFDLLPRSVNQTALDERLERGEKIPGLKKFTAKVVSCTKV